MPSNMRFSDTLIGLVLLAGAVALGVYAAGLPPMPGQSYGAGLFPGVVALGLGLAAAWLILDGLRRGGALVALAPWARSPRRLLALALTVALVLGYILLADRLGFLPVAFVILAVLLAALGVRWWVAVPLAAVTTAVIHEVFYGLLHVPLPWGLLTSYAW